MELIREDRVTSGDISPLRSPAVLATIVRTMSARPARTVLRFVAGMLAATLLVGCATGLGKDECRTADWRTIGYEDGLRGLPADRIGAHRVACAKHQVTPDLAAYTEGRERGLLEYCQPRNGFRAGINGWSYANVCPGATEPAFVQGYRVGREIHDARSELRSTRSRLQSARNGLAQTDVAVQSVTLELVQPDVPTPRRVFLAQELVRLAEQRTELEARINHLTLRTRELVGSVQELERQSPYPL
jgi:Protein of unknown function (DUF2799)